MLFIPPPNRKRPRSHPLESMDPDTGVLILRVTLEDALTVTWHFSSTYSGDSACLALTVHDATRGWVSPDAVDAPDEISIRAFYSGITLSPASPWQLLTPIDGLTFTAGVLIVPQGGAVLP